MSVHPADIILARIDKVIEDEQDDGFRDHLGGSMIGEDCLRALWYGFRWATQKRHNAQLLRLFERGHKEEFRFVSYLKGIGAEVQAYSQRLMYHPDSDSYTLEDWDNDNEALWADCVCVTDDEAHVKRAEEKGVKLKQWRILDVDGHFGGSKDGHAYKLPGVELFGLTEKDPVLLEFKTHGQKSFDVLLRTGLLKSKPKHYAQMQVYMTKSGIKLGLYMAVNKNTDELFACWVECAPQVGAHMLGKARDVIVSPIPMPRISNNPSWFACRFCDHYKVCHHGERMAKNCRTCAFSKPIEDGKWYCARWSSVIPSANQRTGCDHYSEIPT